MERWFYTYAGLNIASAIPIPEWQIFERQPCDEDVSILLGDVVMRDDYYVDTKEYRFIIPDIAQYRIREGCEIIITPLPGVEQKHIRNFLLGSAWGALCYQRGMLLFHASAVCMNEAAIMFCAPSDMGKTTLAAWLTKRGYALVSEDLCNIEVPPMGEPVIYPATPRLKLWDDALGALDLHDHKKVQCRFRPEKYYLEWKGHSEILPLRAIYALKWGELGVERLTGQEALVRLMESATYFHWDELEAMGQVEAYTRHCLNMVGRVPVFEFSRPRDLTSMDKTTDFLVKHWEKGN